MTPPSAMPPFAIVIPANDEAAWIDRCLGALHAQEGAGPARVLVSANACTDGTEARAEAWADRFAERGWTLEVLSSPEPGKLPALNRADAALDGGDGPGAGGARLYLDADVICAPPLVAQIREALAPARPLYATGTIEIARAATAATRAYARIWRETPFVRGGAVGAGVFAVNAAGRARWDRFPEDIISDDTFARLHFAPDERIEVPARYRWPMVEGLANLTGVRRRQDEGVRQIAARWPALIRNEGKAGWERAHLARLAATDPVGVAAYGWVHVATRLRAGGGAWTRGR